MSNLFQAKTHFFKINGIDYFNHSIICDNSDVLECIKNHKNERYMLSCTFDLPHIKSGFALSNFIRKKAQRFLKM